jgi:hypothetical protein
VRDGENRQRGRRGGVEVGSNSLWGGFSRSIVSGGWVTRRHPCAHIAHATMHDRFGRPGARARAGGGGTPRTRIAMPQQTRVGPVQNARPTKTTQVLRFMCGRNADVDIKGVRGCSQVWSRVHQTRGSQFKPAPAPSCATCSCACVFGGSVVEADGRSASLRLEITVHKLTLRRGRFALRPAAPAPRRHISLQRARR